jgi:glycosyltransferase involved in cell wall biosynthesis
MAAPDVTIISPYPARGEAHGGSSGVASYTRNLAQALTGEGAHVAVVAPAEPGEPERSADGAVEVCRVFRRGAAALPTAARAAAATGAPAVHLQHETFLYGGPASVAGLAPALGALRGRSVVTMHHVVSSESVDRGFTRLHRVRAPASVARAGLAAVQGAIRRLAGGVIVHEPAFAEVVRGACVVPHGVERVDEPIDRTGARARLGLDDGRLTVLCFGFVAPYKGLEQALAAAALAPAAVELVVAGGEHPRLAAGGDRYAAELCERHAGHSRFTGFVPDDDVHDWFAAADLALFLHPQPVSSSGALALALAHGTPFLASAALAGSAGAPEAVVAPDGAAALAARLRELDSDRAQLDDLRAACAAMAADRAWPRVARRHLELYEEVSDAHRRAGWRLRAA